MTGGEPVLFGNNPPFQTEQVPAGKTSKKRLAGSWNSYREEHETNMYIDLPWMIVFILLALLAGMLLSSQRRYY